MDLDVVMRSNDCPAIVQFYGALFKEVCIPTIYYMALNWILTKSPLVIEDVR